MIEQYAELLRESQILSPESSGTGDNYELRDKVREALMKGQSVHDFCEWLSDIEMLDEDIVFILEQFADNYGGGHCDWVKEVRPNVAVVIEHLIFLK